MGGSGGEFSKAAEGLTFAGSLKGLSGSETLLCEMGDVF